ncbi:MAG: InlB B-repeat-containing protein, partial [Oscillospiraceae bacterium]|nr:InlB B-repeat-containing protein [Oscillospiraceae bacterium]
TFSIPDFAYAPEAMEGNLTGITLPGAAAPEGYTFAGWVTERVEDATEAPEMYKAGAKFTVTENVTMYALYAYSVGGNGGTGGYQLATDAAQLLTGAKIVIVSAAEDRGSFYAISTNQKSSNRGATAVVVDGTTVEITEDVQVLTLEAGTEAGTLAFNTGSGYLYAASGSGNQLKTQKTLDAKGSWKIVITDGVASIVAADNSVRNVMQYNPNTSADPLFACYAGASQKALAIYVETTGGATYYTTEYAVAEVDGENFSKVAEALEAAETAAAPAVLLVDAFVTGNLDLYATLDLAGNALSATGIVDAANADAHIIDSVGTGVLTADEIMMYETNDMLAIDAANDGKLSYETIEVKQRTTVSNDVTKVNFYINKAAADTKLDDAILAGNDVKIRLTVTWTEGGAEKSHSFVYSQDLVDLYTADWDNKMFKCNITGMNELENASVIAEVVSCGVVLQAFVVA